MQQKIKRKDKVMVLTGKSKGHVGEVLDVFSKPGRNHVNWYCVVQGANMVVRHTKPNPNAGKEGGRISKEMKIHASNLALVDAHGKPSRVAVREVDGRRVRVFKTTDQEVPHVAR